MSLLDALKRLNDPLRAHADKVRAETPAGYRAVPYPQNPTVSQERWERHVQRLCDRGRAIVVGVAVYRLVKERS